MRRPWTYRMLSLTTLLVLSGFGLCIGAEPGKAAGEARVSQEPNETEQTAETKAAATPESETIAEVSDQETNEGEGEKTGRAKCEEIKSRHGKKNDVVAIGEHHTIEAGEVIQGDAVVVGGDLSIDGAIVGDAVCVGGRIHTGPEAVICGDLVTVGGIAEIDPNTFVGGQKATVGGLNLGPLKFLRHLSRIEHEKPHIKGWTWGLGERFVELVSEVVFFLFLLFLGFLMTVFLPRQMDRIEEHLEQDFPRSALLGVAVMVLMPIAVLVLIVTCVGILFIPFLGLAVVVAGILGYLAFSHVLGRRLIGEKQELIQILIGLLLLQSASIFGCLIALPGGIFETIGVVFETAGTVILLGAATIGLGAVLCSRWGKRTLEESQAARKRNGRSIAMPDTPQI